MSGRSANCRRSQDKASAAIVLLPLDPLPANAMYIGGLFPSWMSAYSKWRVCGSLSVNRLELTQMLALQGIKISSDRNVRTIQFTAERNQLRHNIAPAFRQLCQV